MTVNTGISSSLRRPQTLHTFTYQQGGRSLVPLPQRLLMIGTGKARSRPARSCRSTTLWKPTGSSASGPRSR